VNRDVPDGLADTVHGMSDAADPRWLYVEKVVTTLERHIDEFATVEHDVELPVLGSSPGRTRQCDVVIRSGTPRRPTITIVEVQARASKPSIDNFGGWLDKMNEVGAQHLLCVSEKGFPASIVERAAKLGPAVRLLNLTKTTDLHHQLVGVTPPKTILTAEYHEICDVCATDTSGAEVELVPGGFGLQDIDAKLIDFGNDNLQSIAEVLDRHLFVDNPLLDRLERNQVKKIHVALRAGEGRSELGRLVRPERPISIVRLDIRVDLEVIDCPIDWSSARYVQNETDELAWVLEGRICDDENDVGQFVIPVRRRTRWADQLQLENSISSSTMATRD